MNKFVLASILVLSAYSSEYAGSDSNTTWGTFKKHNSIFGFKLGESTIEDKEFYLNTLSKYSQKWAFDIWAYCLMPNHIHILAVPREFAKEGRTAEEKEVINMGKSPHRNFRDVVAWIEFYFTRGRRST